MTASCSVFAQSNLGEPYLFLDLDPQPGGSSHPDGFWRIGDKIFFTANLPEYGRELWVTDGTVQGTYMVRDIWPGPEGPPWINFQAVTVVGSRLFFQADDGSTGDELWVSDGTYAGTYLVKDINPSGSSDPSGGFTINSPMAVWGTSAAFSADDGVTGRELWVSDGTEAGTRRVKDIDSGPQSSHPEWITNLNGLLLFSPDHDNYGNELWRSDGTTAGTHLLRDICVGTQDSYPSWLTVLDGWVYFAAWKEFGKKELWRSNGTYAGLQQVTELDPEEGSDPSNLTVHNGWIYFSSYGWNDDRELWRVNSDNYVDLVKNINPTGWSNPSAFQPVDELLFFRANDGVHGYEAWMTDGTPAGTKLLKDINPTGDSDPYGFVRAGELIYFAADDGIHGRELWVTDLTDQGTYMLRDLYPGPTPSYAAVGELINGRLLFIADDGVNGRELWAIDVERPIIPAASSWAMLLLSLGTCISATILIRTRCNTHALQQAQASVC
jgi:ELWxxDGT repeat protein